MPNVETILLVVIGLVVLFVVVAMLRAVRIVPQSYAIIVERLGKFQAEYFAGLHLLMPFIDRVRTTVDLREQVVSFLFLLFSLYIVPLPFSWLRCILSCSYVLLQFSFQPVNFQINLYGFLRLASPNFRPHRR